MGSFKPILKIEKRVRLFIGMSSLVINKNISISERFFTLVTLIGPRTSMNSNMVHKMCIYSLRQFYYNGCNDLACLQYVLVCIGLLRFITLVTLMGPLTNMNSNMNNKMSLHKWFCYNDCNESPSPIVFA